MKYLKHAVALLITTVCLYIAFRGVNLEEALQIFDKNRIRILPLSVFTILCLGVMWVRAWRWKYFYQKQHKAGIGGLTVSNLIGFASNNILPLRIGEMVRALMARRKVAAPLSYTLATLFVERFFDTLCVLLCLIIPLLFSRQFPPFVVKVGLIVAFVFSGGIIVLLILRGKPNLAMKMALPVGRKIFPEHLFERFEHFLVTFTEGIKILRNGSAMWKITIISFIHWWLVVFSYDCAFRGFSFDSLPWSAPYLTLGFVALGVALPSAPAFVGPIHAAIIYTLSEAYGIDKSVATGFAVIMHLLMMGPITFVGLAMMWREGLTLSQIRQKTDHLEEEGASEPVLQDGTGSLK
ncbi:MAG TPA: lysylphosphatidylglycerol synthase transmembrane domain-containing protein [archaeon]|nr:lysylphosphatidylglycerol synthase transmembrane domain-containing protein [archaeon]